MALTLATAGKASPVTTVLAWFNDINRKDRAAVEAVFAPSASGMGDWTGGPSQWPTFSDVSCQPVSQIPTTAEVSCTFQESASPDEGNPDTFWDVNVQLFDGKWLITNYGQG